MPTAMFSLAMLMCLRLSDAVSFITKDVLSKATGNQSDGKDCASLGRKCVPNYSKYMSHMHQFMGPNFLRQTDAQPPMPDTCCSSLCLNSICEDPEYTLFKCTWTQKGVDWICRDGTLSTLGLPIPYANMAGWQCPRWQDPVSDMDWKITYMVSGVDTLQTFMNSDLDSMGDIAQVANALGPGALGVFDLSAREQGRFNRFGWMIQQIGIKLPFIDYFQCGAYSLECTWTTKGVQKYTELCEWDRQIETGAAYKVQFDDIEGELEAPFMVGPCDAGPKYAGDKATYMQLGIKDDKWYKWAEYGLLTCETPHEKFTARTQVNVKAQAVQCGNLPYNCKSMRQAEDACKLWSADPAHAGKYSGVAELCYKHELAETIGPSCRPMWVKDSEGIEGCYESNNNWWEVRDAQLSPYKPVAPISIEMKEPLRKEYADTTTCEGNLGDVICMYANKVQGQEEQEEHFGRRIQYDHNYGFDAACCIGHMPNPFRDTEGPWADWKKKHGEFAEGNLGSAFTDEEGKNIGIVADISDTLAGSLGIAMTDVEPMVVP